MVKAELVEYGMRLNNNGFGVQVDRVDEDMGCLCLRKNQQESDEIIEGQMGFLDMEPETYTNDECVRGKQHKRLRTSSAFSLHDDTANLG